MAARKNNTNKNMSTGAAPGSPGGSPAPGGDGAEVAEERTEVVAYAASRSRCTCG